MRSEPDEIPADLIWRRPVVPEGPTGDYDASDGYECLVADLIVADRRAERWRALFWRMRRRGHQREAGDLLRRYRDIEARAIKAEAGLEVLKRADVDAQDLYDAADALATAMWAATSLARDIRGGDPRTGETSTTISMKEAYNDWRALKERMDAEE